MVNRNIHLTLKLISSNFELENANMKEEIALDRYSKIYPCIFTMSEELPHFCQYPITEIPFEIYNFKNFSLSRQQFNLYGIHLQILNAVCKENAVIPFLISRNLISLFFIIRGSLKSLNENQDNTDYLIGPLYSIVYFPAGKLNLNIKQGIQTLILITFKVWLPSYKKGNFLQWDKVIDCTETNEPHIYALPFTIISKKVLNYFYKIYDHLKTIDEECLEILFLIKAIFKEYEFNTKKPVNIRKQKELILKSELEKYVAQNYMFEEECKIKNVTSKLCISDWSLQNICYKYFSKTYHQYLLHIRIYTSIKLLCKTPINIRKIAIECGFTSHSHFGKTFRKIMNISPRLYRKLHKSF